MKKSGIAPRAMEVLFQFKMKGYTFEFSNHNPDIVVRVYDKNNKKVYYFFLMEKLGYDMYDHTYAECQAFLTNKNKTAKTIKALESMFNA